MIEQRAVQTLLEIGSDFGNELQISWDRDDDIDNRENRIQSPSTHSKPKNPNLVIKQTISYKNSKVSQAKPYNSPYLNHSFENTKPPQNNPNSSTIVQQKLTNTSSPALKPHQLKMQAVREAKGALEQIYLNPPFNEQNQRKLDFQLNQSPIHSKQDRNIVEIQKFIYPENHQNRFQEKEESQILSKTSSSNPPRSDNNENQNQNPQFKKIFPKKSVKQILLTQNSVVVKAPIQDSMMINQINLNQDLGQLQSNNQPISSLSNINEFEQRNIDISPLSKSYNKFNFFFDDQISYSPNATSRTTFNQLRNQNDMDYLGNKTFDVLSDRHLLFYNKIPLSRKNSFLKNNNRSHSPQNQINNQIEPQFDINSKVSFSPNKTNTFIHKSISPAQLQFEKNYQNKRNNISISSEQRIFNRFSTTEKLIEAVRNQKISAVQNSINKVIYNKGKVTILKRDHNIETLTAKFQREIQVQSKPEPQENQKLMNFFLTQKHDLVSSQIIRRVSPIYPNK